MLTKDAEKVKFDILIVLTEDGSAGLVSLEKE